MGRRRSEERRKEVDRALEAASSDNDDGSSNSSNSSSSSSSSSSNDHGDRNDGVEATSIGSEKKINKRVAAARNDGDDSDSSGSWSDDDDDKDNGSIGDADSKDSDDDDSEAEDHNDDPDDADASARGARSVSMDRRHQMTGSTDLSLSEKIQQREEQGWVRRSSTYNRQERKSKALEIATQRLAKMKGVVGNNSSSAGSRVKKRKEKTSETMVNDADGESDSDSDNDNDDRHDSLEKHPRSYSSKKKQKKSKNQPTEVSSRRADFFRRGAPQLNQSGLGVAIGANRYKPLDPRTSNLSGHFNEEQFQANYAFLEEMRNREIGQVRRRIAARRATGNKGRRLRSKLQLTGSGNDGAGSLEEDEARLKILTQQRADLERRKVDREAKQSVKRKIRGEVETGQRGAYFLKRKDQKRLELEAKLEVLRKRSGGEKAVEKVMAKRRKKQKSKDASLFAK